MSRLRLKFIQAFIDRHGRARHYFRRPGHKGVALPGLPGSPEFMEAYGRAFAGTPPIEVGASKRSGPGSLSSAVASYYGSNEFRGLAPATQRRHRAVLERFREQHGAKPMHLLPRKFIVDMLGSMTPHQGANWLKVIRALCQYCVAHEMIDTDPTSSIKVRTPKSDGHRAWTDDDVARYEAAHPIGTKARLAFALGLYTAQRRGDVIRMGPQHIRDGTLTLRQSKTRTPLLIPVRSELQAIIDATRPNI
jgi:integrase